MNTETQYFIISSLSTTCILFLFYIFRMYVLKRRKRSVLNCLYRLIYSRIKSKETINSLCAEFRKHLTLEEGDLIESHFTINKPSVKLHTEFYVNKFYFLVKRSVDYRNDLASFLGNNFFLNQYFFVL